METIIEFARRVVAEHPEMKQCWVDMIAWVEAGATWQLEVSLVREEDIAAYDTGLAVNADDAGAAEAGAEQQLQLLKDYLTSLGIEIMNDEEEPCPT